MAASPLPLLKWFSAIRTMQVDASISPAKLQESLGITRLATVRNMRSKILAAMESAHSDRLLAGLIRLRQAP